jgi:hypothetical protein
VGDLENGRAAATLPTFVAAAAALGDVIDRQVTFAELFAGSGNVAINDTQIIPLAKLRIALSGETVAIRAPRPRPVRNQGTTCGQSTRRKRRGGPASTGHCT